MTGLHPKPAVIVISSHVARGSVGNRAAVFALETLGFPVWAIATIQLPWHPGHGPATRIVASDQAFSDFLADIERAPWIDEVGAVLSGYMANPAQTQAVASLVTGLRKTNPDLVYLCDPVIGDSSGLYVPEETASAIRDNLVPHCDITTPNLYELAWLTDTATPSTLVETASTMSALGIPEVLVTSAPGTHQHKTGNLLATRSETLFAGHRELLRPPNGPGDLTAAIFLGHRLSGLPDRKNLSKTTASVLEILEQSARRRSNELTLETDSASIVSPANVLKVISLPELAA